jgi:shikimate kinase
VRYKREDMSVEIVGAQGFDYQYTVTLYMILKYLEMDHFEVLVENESFEDAKLSYQLEDKTYHIELQVKKKASEIAYDEFATWLAHFQKSKSDCFILDRIQQSDTNYLVFVTNNRCTDNVSKFVGKENEIKENKICFSAEMLKDLKLRMLKGIDNKNELGRKRKEHIEQYFNQKKNELNKVLGRVYIIERKDQIEREIYIILKEQYQIPKMICRDVMNQMLDVVRQGRDSGEDITALIREILKNKRFSRVLPEDKSFYKRDSIDILKSELLQKNLLLLTGVPFSGKTYIAKTIAQELQDNGYYVKLTDNIIEDQEAYYFLMSPENDSRLLLIEDPFGHIGKSENYIQIRDKIEGLIRDRLSINRKVIITSRLDILLDVFQKKQIEECKIQGNGWINTSISSKEEAEKIWLRFYGESDESLQVFERLKRSFDHHDETVFLEIGEMRHLLLSVQNINVLTHMSTDEIIKQARISSEEVCRKIKSYGETYKDIFILLGCFCNTVRSVSVKDLAYILCSNEESVSIRQKMEEEVTVSIGDRQKNSHIHQEFPVYAQMPKLDEDIISILRVLCEKGYIYKERITNEIYFLHPIYTYASKLLLQEEIEDDWDIEKYIKYMRRAIGSLSSNAAFCSLCQLGQEFDREQMIIDCIVEGSRSIFPAIRDVSILYLDQNFDNLNEQVQKDFMKNIRNGRTADKYMQWNGNECWYQMDGKHYFDFFNMDDFWGKDINFTLEEIEERVRKKENFSKKEIYDILSSSLADNLSREFLEYTLLSDEAVIRSRAIFYLFKNYAAKLDFEKTEYLQRFENYNVVYGMLKGMFSSVNDFSEENVKKLIIYFQKQFERKSVSMYVEDLFDKFGDEYDSKAIDWGKYAEAERLRIWKIWAALFSKWLVCFPAKFMGMNEPHMSLNIDRSLKYLNNQKEVVDVANAWIQWIHNYSKYHSVNDYGMSVLDYLITGTKNSACLRKGMIKKELKVNSTSLVTAHISHIVDLWDMLTDEERKDICEYLKNEMRGDMKWIQAVALTRKNVTKDIQIAITGNVFLDKEPKKIIDTLNEKNILTECLHIFCGFPQPLWFNGYHHSGKYSLWDGVMMEVLKKDIVDENYNISLREMIDELYNNNDHRFVNGYDVYKEMLSDEEKRKQIFERLAYTSVTQNQDNKKMWDELLQACSEEEKKQYFLIISNFIEMVEYENMGYNGLLCEYELKDIVHYILPCFSSDQSIYKLSDAMLLMYRNIQEMEVDESKKVKQLYETMVQETYKNDPPRLLFTNKIVNYTCKEMGGVSDVMQKVLEKNKKDFWDRYERVKETFESNCPLKIREEYRLENWYD